MTGAGELAMFLAVGAAAVGLLFGPIGAAVARRIGGRADSEVHAEIDAVRDGLTAEVDQLRGRLAEVEERLDFAERLLASERSLHQLPGGEQR